MPSNRSNVLLQITQDELKSGISDTQECGMARSSQSNPSPKAKTMCWRSVRHRVHRRLVPTPSGGGGGKERVGKVRVGSGGGLMVLLLLVQNVKNLGKPSVDVRMHLARALSLENKCWKNMLA